VINIFIGTSDYEDEWIEKIYVYSLLKNTKAKLNIRFLRPRDFPDWNRDGWGTPFTCFRYAIPELMGFQGRAIYTDVDMLCLGDIEELWNWNLKGKPFAFSWDWLMSNGTKWNNTAYERGWWSDSVIVMDCEKAKPHVAPIETMARWKGVYKWEFFNKMGSPIKEKSLPYIEQLPGNWNCFDGRNPGHKPKDFEKQNQQQFTIEEIRLLHMTTLSSQPWHPTYSPHAKSTHERQDLMELVWEYNKEATWIAKSIKF
jgi:lipopolysaccharide biosynthesis glycosyltransferase